MVLLTVALAVGDPGRPAMSAGDLEFSLRLHVYSAPGATVTVAGEGGELTLEGLGLRVTPYEQHHLDLPDDVRRATGETEPSADGDSSSEVVDELPDPGTLPAPDPDPDPDIETTGPIEIATHRPWSRQRG